MRTNRVTLESETDVGYVDLAPIAVGRIAQTGPLVIRPAAGTRLINLDFDGAGALVGIEFDGARAAMPRTLIGSLPRSNSQEVGHRPAKRGDPSRIRARPPATSAQSMAWSATTRSGLSGQCRGARP